MPTQNIQIIKANGEPSVFNPQKVLGSIQRTGADEATAKAVLHEIEKNLKDGMHTKEIYQMVREELKRQQPWAAARYNLRDAINRMGPAGYNFEKYVASVLDAYGYVTDTPGSFQGACVSHETDVTAEKDGRRIFIEAKFRRDYNGTVNIKDTLATWARFLDLVDGSKIGLCPHFDEVWIVTNARFTDQSLKFGHCKNMKMVGWNHPSENSFAHMVDINALYPITIIDGLSPKEITNFAKANIMLCREISQKTQEEIHQETKIPMERVGHIMEVCEPIMKGPNT
jgi:hypothetical protein